MVDAFGKRDVFICYHALLYLTVCFHVDFGKTLASICFLKIQISVVLYLFGFYLNKLSFVFQTAELSEEEGEDVLFKEVGHFV